MPVADSAAAPLLLIAGRQSRQHLGDPCDFGIELSQAFRFAFMEMAVNHRRTTIGRARHGQRGDQFQFAGVAQHGNARAEQHGRDGRCHGC